MDINDVKKRIKLMGIKKSYVAKNIGVSPMTLSHYLGGRRSLNDDSMYLLKKFLGL